MGCSKSSTKREVNSHKCLHLKRRTISYKQPNFILQGARKRRTMSKVRRRKEMTKIRAEINKIEDRKINKTKS